MKSAALLLCLLAVGQGDPVRDAQTLIEQGHPWRATQTIAPALRGAPARSPATVIVAARAAAGWGGWAEVDRLLAGETWLDAQFDGEARELLARSALERGADTLAVAHAAAAAAAVGATPEARGVRVVLLARALERISMFDSAAASYRRASELLPRVRDWLALRAAGNASDSATRARLLASVTLPVAKPRRAWTEAQARERFADAVGASSRYAALGATVMSLRLRISVAPDSAAREAIAAELLAFIKNHNGSADAKSAVEALDKAQVTLTSAGQLTVARSSAVSGPPARAAAGFQRAMAEPLLLLPNDHLLYAQVLTRVGRMSEALGQFDAVQGPLAGQAAYQRARAQLASVAGTTSRAALREVVARFSGDTLAAASALYLLADLATDDGDDAKARALDGQLYADYPTSPRAAGARFGAAVIALAQGDAKTAGREFDSLLVRMPRSEEAIAARYWSGRAWSASGNPTLARARWREVVAQQPLSYYAVVAAKRLGQAPWTPAAGPDSLPTLASVDSAAARGALLERLGMDVEERFEYDALEAAATTPDRMLATAGAFLSRGQPARAMRLAQKLVDAGQRDVRVYRLLFPVLDREELIRDAKARGLDPALVAGLIRQESGFNPRAVSVAGARGLMQVLPPVGEEVARSLGYPVWSPALLVDADANLQLGTAHLASFFKQYSTLPRVLAAYNAGGSRATRWSSKAGTNDPELFTERVPFAETREYVRIVQRNAAIYAGLYSW